MLWLSSLGSLWEGARAMSLFPTWDPLSPTGLPCPGLMWWYVPDIIVWLISLEGWLFSERRQRNCGSRGERRWGGEAGEMYQKAQFHILGGRGSCFPEVASSPSPSPQCPFFDYTWAQTQLHNLPALVRAHDFSSLYRFCDWRTRPEDAFLK